jgi:hypothetical protein
MIVSIVVVAVCLMYGRYCFSLASLSSDLSILKSKIEKL